MSPFTTLTCIKGRTAFVGHIWRERGPTTELERRKGVELVEQAPEGLCMAHQLLVWMVSEVLTANRTAWHLSWPRAHISASQVFKSCVFSL